MKRLTRQSINGKIFKSLFVDIYGLPTPSEPKERAVAAQQRHRNDIRCKRRVCRFKGLENPEAIVFGMVLPKQAAKTHPTNTVRSHPHLKMANLYSRS